MLQLVPREPDSGEAASTKLVGNFIAHVVVVVAQVNRMEATLPVSLQVFGFEVDALKTSGALHVVFMLGGLTSSLWNVNMERYEHQAELDEVQELVS